jgi:hypothetical protein
MSEKSFFITVNNIVEGTVNEVAIFSVLMSYYKLKDDDNEYEDIRDVIIELLINKFKISKKLSEFIIDYIEVIFNKKYDFIHINNITEKIIYDIHLFKALINYYESNNDEHNQNLENIKLLEKLKEDIANLIKEKYHLDFKVSYFIVGLMENTYINKKSKKPSVFLTPLLEIYLGKIFTQK